MEPKLDNKNYLIERFDYNKPLSEEEENQLIKNNFFTSLKFYDLKVDILFKTLFGEDSNKDITISLLKAILPEGVEYDDLDIVNTKVRYLEFPHSVWKNIIDIYVQDKKNKNKYIFEMLVHETPDTLFLSELEASKLFCSLYNSNESLEQKIYSVNFLYNDMFPNDIKYYHHFCVYDQYNKNISLPFKETIVIELKKYKEQFNISQIKDEDIQNEKKETIRNLWLLFLSSINTINTVYDKPRNIDTSRYFTNEKKCTITDEDGNEKEKISKVYIQNEITKQHYKKLIKLGAIRKALGICMYLGDINKIKKELDNKIEEQYNIIKEKENKIKDMVNAFKNYLKRNNQDMDNKEFVKKFKTEY